MIILFDTHKLGKILSDDKLLRRHYGDSGPLIRIRLDDLKAAENLAIVFTLPQHRCHELHGRQRGQFSVDLLHPLRLVFEPADVPAAEKKDGGIDLTGVRIVKIVGIMDTH